MLVTFTIATILSGCISFYDGYVFISGVNDLDDAYKKVNKLITTTAFKALEGNDESAFKYTSYGYQIVEEHERGLLNRDFSISVWKDTEKQQIVLIFGEANVRGFSKDGKRMFEDLRHRLISEFGENSVVFGEDKDTLDALWKRLHVRKGFGIAVVTLQSAVCYGRGRFPFNAMLV